MLGGDLPRLCLPYLPCVQLKEGEEEKQEVPLSYICTPPPIRLPPLDM